MRVKLADVEQAARCEDWTPPEQFETYPQFAGAAKQFSEQRQSVLESIVENQIIPRLLLANAPSPALDATAAKLSARVGEFAELVIRRDAAASLAYFATLRTEGASIEALFQDLLAPAARRLGELWDEDINDFMDVTRGVMHLQLIVHEFSHDLKQEGRRSGPHRRALLMPVPGEQHTFGVSLVGEHFRREGWRVWGGPPKSIDEIVELVDGQWFDVVGLSASRLPDPSRIASQIRAIRQASHNPEVKVLVGGHVFAQDTSLVAAVGADATAIDGRHAVLQVVKLIGSDRKSI